MFIILCICTHSYRIPGLEDVVPNGIVCPEMWVFGLCVQMSYYRVDLLTAFLYTCWALPQMMIAQYMASNQEAYTMEVFGENRSFLWMVTAVHVTAWIAQFYGHGVHEQRAPALMENLGFALLAPFFVTFEFLHYGSLAASHYTYPRRIRCLIKCKE